MACDPQTLRQVPLFALLDDDEIAVLAGQVEVRNFAPRQRIYKMGDSGGRAYIMVSGWCAYYRGQQQGLVDGGVGEFFGFASVSIRLHQTSAAAVEPPSAWRRSPHPVLLGANRTPEWICWPCSASSTTLSWCVRSSIERGQRRATTVGGTHRRQ